ncbi:MAG: excinuclease ABC subunit UvrC [Terriglobales bacterium]
MDLVTKARSLPASPGVYRFKDAAGQILYVGKAKNLRSRVRSYFLAGRVEDAKTGSLLREAADLDTVVVDTEAEALALENSLIKQLQPRFNVLLRDDKTYPYIRLSRERWPRVYVTRRLQEDGSEYFGPYFPASLAYRMVKFIHRYFLVPSCRVDLTHFHPRPCLQFHIHRCLGPCVAGLTTDAAYADAVQNVRLFLGGHGADLQARLQDRRDQAAAAERFEEAAACRDLLRVLADAQERQKVDQAEGQDADVIGLQREGERAAINLFHVRHGRIVDRREFFWEDLPADSSTPAPCEADDGGDASEDHGDAGGASALMGAFVKQLYLQRPYVPARILLPVDFADRAALAVALAAQRGGKVELLTPQRGAQRALLELAQKNAAHSFTNRFRLGEAAEQRLATELQAAFGLAAPARRIECFDISHFQGADTVASLVVWEEGRMKKADYRHFIIRGVAGVDDFRSMEEVVRRRYRRAAAGESGADWPSLVLVDGGLGQLHAAQRALGELGAGGQPAAALAKREEWLYLAGREAEPLRLPPHSPVRRTVQNIRDEAHRFAVAFHRRRRQRRMRSSPLLAAPGIGPVTARRLLRRFGSLQGVRQASREQWAEVLSARQVAALDAVLAQEPSPAASE